MNSNPQLPRDDGANHRPDDDVTFAPTTDSHIAFNKPQLPIVDLRKGHDAMMLTEKEVDSADECDERDVKKGQV